MQTSKALLKKIYGRREKWSHKGQYGKLVVIAGCERHTGSACFVGMAACRVGCDLVYVASPQRSADIAANFSPCLITEPLKGDKLETRHVKKILDMIKEVRGTAVVIGPGLWREDETNKAIVKLIDKIDLPMVIDADAIRAVAGNVKLLRKKKCVLTPHADEFRNLTGKFVNKNLEQRIKTVKEEANKISNVIALKGSVDVISDGKKIMLNNTGSVLMTKGGFGDTMTGICGAYLARGNDTFLSACAAAYVNGKAGEISSRKHGEGLLPTDMLEEIVKVIK
ncbi:MAG: NAD(P)H-hydrate dehydratase [Candidatus Aenigmarchaeota archaeon]|nr:NAD(P)H-hydrate dehydratase [Candidatus Aenigmarchaeota archaeon]